MTVDKNKQIALRAFEAFAAADLRPLHDLLAPSAVLHQCGFLHPIPARAILQGEFPTPRLVDREVRLERTIGEDDLVALHWRTTGRYAESDVPERAGKRVSFPSMSFLRIEHGRIIEIWNIQDTATLQTQLQEPGEPVPAG